MNRNAQNQPTLALILLATGLSAVVAGLVLGLVVDPWLFVVCAVGISDLVISRWYLTRGGRALPIEASAGKD